MKVVLGAGRTQFDGWISTQESDLNLLNRADFEKMFGEQRPTAFLAEHVWEHMTLEEGVAAAKNCFDFLEDGGYIRTVFEQAGFEVELLEYCDESGTFHYKYWNEEDGRIGRSLRFDTRNSLEKLGMVSIIVDARKVGRIAPAELV